MVPDSSQPVHSHMFFTYVCATDSYTQTSVHLLQTRKIFMECKLLKGGDLHFVY